MARASRRSILAEGSMKKEELEQRKGIIAACRSMNALGVNQGTSGNISARYRDVMLITPSGVPYEDLKPADIVFFAPDGRDATASSVYHAGLYLGKGWMIHSSGGRAGISLAEIGPGSWWNDQLAWGRRIIE